MDEIGPILTANRRPSGKLSETLRAAIYSLYSAGYSHTIIIRKFGCYWNTIANTIKRF